jgi:pSer/pThr/pTyr-binding forkhead associated (FHA) protein
MQDDFSENEIRIELLDSGSGRVVQVWTFSRSDVISIGRSAENKIVIQDPYVSRHHADLEFAGGRWLLTNRGRHGILLDGGDIGESVSLEGAACFQLGGLGPALRVRQGRAQQPQHDTTMISAPMRLPLGGIMIDRERMRQEVEVIAKTSYFQELQQVRRRMRAAGA